MILPVILSSLTRAMLRVAAAIYLGLGVVLFVAPAWSAGQFPWSVTPFVAMTIGGWSLGTGAAALVGSRPSPVGAVLPVLAYLWLFAAAELVVLLAFRDAVHLAVVLSVPYLASLLLTLGSAAVGINELRRPAPTILEEARRGWGPVRLSLFALTVFLVGLALGGGLAGLGGLSTTGQIFPEPLTLFSVRAFAAFYLALAFAVGIAVARPTVESHVNLAIAGVSLIVPITVAAFLNFSAFDFGARPLGLLYLGAYLVVFFPTVLFLWRPPGRARA